MDAKEQLSAIVDVLNNEGRDWQNDGLPTRDLACAILVALRVEPPPREYSQNTITLQQYRDLLERP